MDGYTLSRLKEMLVGKEPPLALIQEENGDVDTKSKCTGNPDQLIGATNPEDHSCYSRKSKLLTDFFHIPPLKFK